MTQATMTLDGPRLNLENCDQIKQQGKAPISSSGASHLTIDMARVTFVDSSGLGALVALRKAVGANGSVTLNNPNDFVMRVLDLTKLRNVFQVAPAG